MTLKDYLNIEDDQRILNFKFAFDDFLMWPFIRFYLYWVAMKKRFEIVDPWIPARNLSFIDKIGYFKNTMLSNPYREGRKKYDILMFCSGITNIMKEKSYFNRVSDYFAFITADRALLIEDSFYRKYYRPRYFPSICYHDFIELKADSECSSLEPNSKDVKTVHGLLEFIEKNFIDRLEKLELECIKNTLFGLSRKIKIYYNLYNKLYDKLKPKIIFLEDASYGARSYILRWAKLRNIITMELQHGLISENHAAYNYGAGILNSNVYKEYLPDYFLEYGRYWDETINLPVKRVIIGNPNYSENTNTIGKKMCGKTRILIVSAGTAPKIMEKITLRISSMVDHDKFELAFRPHPYEVPALKERYHDILSNKLIKIDMAQDLYTSLLNTDFLAGEPSTVLFEGMGICKAVFSIDIPATNLYIPREIIKRFSSPEQLLEFIEKHDFDNPVDKNYIWESNWKENYKNFIFPLLR